MPPDKRILGTDPSRTRRKACSAVCSTALPAQTMQSIPCSAKRRQPRGDIVQRQVGRDLVEGRDVGEIGRLPDGFGKCHDRRPYPAAASMASMSSSERPKWWPIS